MATFEWCDFSPKQLSLIEAPLARITILEGSVRSGKTVASIIRWVLYVGTETAEGAKLLMLGVTSDTLYRNVVSDLLDIVGPEDASYVDGVLTLFGRTIYCIGARDKGAEKRIRGMTVSGCYIDEVTQIPKNVVDQAILRCSKDPGRLIWTTNPDSPFHWCFTEYVGNAPAIASGRVSIFHFLMADNYALSEAYKADVAASFTGLWYKRMVLGLWVIAEGVVYDLFDTNLHGYDDKDEPDRFTRTTVTIDYGTQNPFHALKIGVVGDMSWVRDEYRYCGRDEQRQKTDEEYVDALDEWLGRDRGVEILVDPSASSFKAALRKRGYTRVKDALNDVLPGIRTTASRLKVGKLRIHRTRCKHLLNEFGVYSWDPKAAMRGEDVPLKEHDHGLDALRYHEFTKFGKPVAKAQNLAIDFFG